MSPDGSGTTDQQPDPGITPPGTSSPDARPTPDADPAAPDYTDPAPRRGPLSSHPRLRTLLNITSVALLSAIGIYTAKEATRDEAAEIQFKHDGDEFTLDGLTLEEKIAQIYHGSAYPSRAADLTDRTLNHRKLSSNPRIIEFTDWLTDWLKSSETIGGVHIFRSDARTLDEANRTAIEIMAKSKIPPFITMDIVGGFTKHLGLTQEDAKEYGVPAEFLEMAKAEGTELPSQETLGRAFKALVVKKDFEGQIRFRKQMQEYGVAIARMCRDIGIVVNFAPVLDVVEDIDGDQFMEKNDESYGEDAHTVMALAFHYIKGFQSAGTDTMIAPKHFAGTGKMPSNPHKKVDPGISDMGPSDGTMLPFRDAISGQLFHDEIWGGYTMDHKIRGLQREVKQLERSVAKLAKTGKGRKQKQELGEAEKTLALKKAELAEIYTKYDINPSFTTMPKVQGLMVGHAQNYMNPDTPGSLSPEIVRRRLHKVLEFKGITWTDDMSMGVIDFHVQNGDNQKHDKGPAERFVRALAVDITIPMILHSSGSLKEITERVRQAVNNREDFDGDGTPDITMAGINERVLQILEQKAKLGLLTKRIVEKTIPCFKTPQAPKGQCIVPTTVYGNNSRDYMFHTRAFHRTGNRGR